MANFFSKLGDVTTMNRLSVNGYKIVFFSFLYAYINLLGQKFYMKYFYHFTKATNSLWLKKMMIRFDTASKLYKTRSETHSHNTT